MDSLNVNSSVKWFTWLEKNFYSIVSRDQTRWYNTLNITQRSLTQGPLVSHLAFTKDLLATDLLLFLLSIPDCCWISRTTSIPYAHINWNSWVSTVYQMKNEQQTTKFNPLPNTLILSSLISSLLVSYASTQTRLFFLNMSLSSLPPPYVFYLPPPSCACR